MLCSCFASFFHSTILIWFSFSCSLILHQLASYSPCNCLFLLLLWSKHSHLLNHLVKFVSSGDLLRVFTIFLLKISIQVKCHTIKMNNPKINSLHLPPWKRSWAWCSVVAQARPWSSVRMVRDELLGAHSNLAHLWSINHVVDSCASPRWSYAIPHYLLVKHLSPPSVDLAQLELLLLGFSFYHQSFLLDFSFLLDLLLLSPIDPWMRVNIHIPGAHSCSPSTRPDDRVDLFNADVDLYALWSNTVRMMFCSFCDLKIRFLYIEIGKLE